MLAFRILIEGEPILLLSEGKVRPHGFYINVFAYGHTLENAIEKALNSVTKNLTQHDGVVRESLSDLTMTVEDWESLSDTKNHSSMQQGFVWYPLELS